MPVLPSILILVAFAFLVGWWYTRWTVRRAVKTYPPIGQFVDVGGSKIHYVERGTGWPVVMIHGSDGTLFNFKRSIFDLVSQEYRAIAFDRPGHGHSEARNGQPLTIPFNAGVIRGAVHKLGITRPIVVGYSYGGGVALRWAIDHSDEIAGLVLISPACFPERHLLSVFAYVAGIPLIGPVLVNTMFVPIARPQVAIWARRAFRPDPLPPDILDSVKAYSLRPWQFAAFAEEMRHFNPDLSAQADAYGQITVPVAILAGEDDILLTVSKQAARLSNILPQATLKVFPLTGHEVHYKYREETLAAIRAVAQNI